MCHPFHWYDTGTFLICVDSYESSVCQGLLLSPLRSDATQFTGMVQLLRSMERIMDNGNQPQAFQELRTFAPGMGAVPSVAAAPRYAVGALATFSVQVRFRRNAGWQGTLCWLEGKQTRHFRSVLEWILLLDSALSAGNMQPEGPFDSAV